MKRTNGARGTASIVLFCAMSDGAGDDGIIMVQVIFGAKYNAAISIYVLLRPLAAIIYLETKAYFLPFHSPAYPFLCWRRYNNGDLVSFTQFL